VDALYALIDGGAFRLTTTQMAADLARWATSPAVRAAFEGPCGYVHRDLSGDNLMVLPDGYRVIDWQRPIWGPTDLDRVDLLNSLGYDPLRHVGAGVVQAWLVLSVGWLTEAKARWFPQGTSYDGQVAGLIARLGALARQA
jgi:aminoglycoside/choline kinase family phosphotransferase